MFIIKNTDKHITLEIKDLCVGYKTTAVCSNISFKLNQGEFMAIVGVNGIGKSTLLRTIGNFQPKIAGSILFEGKPQTDFTPIDFSKKVSVVLTEPIASKNLTVIELIALGRQPYTNWIGNLSSTDQSKINEAIQILELHALKQKKCYELSDGQLQRVLIARALAQDTDIILLDEPTTHLDLFHKVQILKLLKSIAHHTNKTIVFTSHEIEMAIQLCDKILILDGHQNSFETPSKLIENKAFESLFPSNTVVFDSRSGAFRIQK
ncbi:ABC transporter ATP-binding protein [Maribacter thermophilus]|uniref:ABC transporter ATP-binding protein n=1 Tax=Maribacter thermophilus TaxID=1197874 RepID=UPI000B2FFBD0|nr:ABC transporter ATP-binding protein [Maribacter thermophilus]